MLHRSCVGETHAAVHAICAFGPDTMHLRIIVQLVCAPAAPAGPRPGAS